jgi:diaminopimelate decarboxylase
LRELNIGGGLGIPYRPEEQPEGPEALAEALRPLLAGRDLHLLLEPGRFIVGPAGALLTRVLYIKSEGERADIVVVDAGMNDLLRPALYGAWHPIYPVEENAVGRGQAMDIAGPICESADFLGRDRRLGVLKPGDLLAIGQAGAYGFSMSSRYNGRPRPAEVLVSGGEATLIRKREGYEDL